MPRLFLFSCFPVSLPVPSWPKPERQLRTLGMQPAGGSTSLFQSSLGARRRIDLRAEAGCSTVEPGQQLPSLCCTLLGSWLPPGMSGPQPVSLRSQDSHRISGPLWLCRMCHEASAVSAFSRNVHALSCSFGSQFLLGAPHCLCTTILVRRQKGRAKEPAADL